MHRTRNNWRGAELSEQSNINSYDSSHPNCVLVLNCHCNNSWIICSLSHLTHQETSASKCSSYVYSANVFRHEHIFVIVDHSNGCRRAATQLCWCITNQFTKTLYYWKNFEQAIVRFCFFFYSELSFLFSILFSLFYYLFIYFFLGIKMHLCCKERFGTLSPLIKTPVPKQNSTKIK